MVKPRLRQGHRPILQKLIGSKEFKLVYDIGGGRLTRNVPVSPEDRASFAIGDEEIPALARWASEIEEHYGTRLGQPTRMDIEWAKDGRTGELHVLQARPETVQSRSRPEAIEAHLLRARGPVLLTGRSVGEKIGRGPVRVLRSARDLHLFRDGEVLVADKTGEAVGEGTSTSTVLAHSLFAEGLKNVAAGASAVDLRRGLDRGLKSAFAAL